MKKVFFSLMFFSLCGFMQAQTAPWADNDVRFPWPINNGDVVYNAAVRLVALSAEPRHPAGSELAGELIAPATYEFFFGESADALTKISGDNNVRLDLNILAAERRVTVASFLYTPEKPLEVGKTYYWQAVATNTEGIYQSAVWRFNVTGAGTLVDIGHVYHGINQAMRIIKDDPANRDAEPVEKIFENFTVFTPTNYPSITGVALIPFAPPPAGTAGNPQVVNQGTPFEMTFTPNTGANIGNSSGAAAVDVYFPSNLSGLWPATAFYRAGCAIGTLTGPGGEDKKIVKVIVNGSSDNEYESRPVGVLFSDMLEFDENSIIGFNNNPTLPNNTREARWYAPYDEPAGSIVLPNLRQLVAREHIIDAPEGTKSFKVIYAGTRLTEVIAPTGTTPGSYRVDTDGSINISAAGARVTYVGAVLADDVSLSAVSDPMPANSASLRLHESIKLSWKLTEGVAIGDLRAYAGIAAGLMEEIEGEITEEDGLYSITYTPETPFVSENFHYWRVDAIMGEETMEGRVWRFRTVALDETELIDLGLDFDGLSDTYTPAKSEAAITDANANTVNADTKKQVTFAPAGATFENNDKGYLATVDMPALLLNETSHIDVVLGPIAVEKKTLIKKLAVNGTGADDGENTIMISFSGEYLFSDENILSSQAVTLGVAGTGLPAIIVDAPVEAKSVRIYGPARIAYIAVELIPLSDDNTIRNMTIEGRATRINHVDNTITVTLPVQDEMFTVEYTLNHADATADYTSGTKRNFKDPLEIEVTAVNDEKRTYTVSVLLPEPSMGSGSGSKKIAMLVHADTHKNIVDDDWATTAQAYDKASHERFMVAFEGHEVESFPTEGTKTLDELLVAFDGYDVVVMHPTVGGNHAHTKSMEAIVGVKPFLNFKAFAYNNEAARWGWATPSNPGDGNTPFVTVAAELQNHPIFKNLFFGGDGTALSLYDVATTASPNQIQRVAALPFTGDEWVKKGWNDFNHLLATHAGTATQTHEINVANEAKYLLFGISTEVGGLVDMSDDAIQLIKNAIDYLGDRTWYYNYDTNQPVGGPIIADINFNDPEKFVDGVYTESPTMPAVTTSSGDIAREDTNPMMEGCGTVGSLRFNGRNTNIQIMFDEPVAKLNIWARTTSGTDPATMSVAFFNMDGEPLAVMEDDKGVPLSSTNVSLGVNSEGTCGFLEVLNIEEPCIVRISRGGTGGTFGVLRIYAERGSGGELIPLSDDNTLSALTVTGLIREGVATAVLPLTPPFDPAHNDYTLRVNNVGSDVTIAAAVNNRSAFLMPEGPGQKDLVVGNNNLFPLRIYAQNGELRTYNIAIDHYELKNIVVTFDAQENGRFEGEQETVKTYRQEHEMLDFPSITPDEGYLFTGWATVREEFDDNKYIAPGTFCMFEDNATLYAQYDVAIYQVTFDANIEGGPTVPTAVYRTHGETVGAAQWRNLENFADNVFMGWYDNEEGEGEPYTADTPITKTVILYAKWQKASETTWTVQFDVNIEGGPAAPESRTIAHGAAIGDLPTLADVGDMELVGWFANKEGTGTQLTAAATVTSNMTLYAKWAKKTDAADYLWTALNLYPNPASDAITISGLEGGELIGIFDTSGRLCLQINATAGTVEISVSNLSKGTYFAKITNGNAEKTVKFVVN